MSLVENIKPFNSQEGRKISFGKMIKDCVLTKSEKNAMFNFGQSKKQISHQKKVKRVGELRKKHGFTFQEAWDIVKKKSTVKNTKQLHKKLN